MPGVTSCHRGGCTLTHMYVVNKASFSNQTYCARCAMPSALTHTNTCTNRSTYGACLEAQSSSPTWTIRGASRRMLRMR